MNSFSFVTSIHVNDTKHQTTNSIVLEKNLIPNNFLLKIKKLITQEN